MSFFISPLKLISILREHRENPSRFKNMSADWYYSPEGKIAYDEANSIPKRIIYFYKYLLTITGKLNTMNSSYNLVIGSERDSANDTNLYKIACIMADSMDHSQLSFAGWPNILLPERNPLVNYVTKHPHKQKIQASELICALQGRSNLNTQNELHKSLTPPSVNADMYLIEREIIWAFCSNADKMGPSQIYNYSCKMDLSNKHGLGIKDNSQHKNSIDEVLEEILQLK